MATSPSGTGPAPIATLPARRARRVLACTGCAVVAQDHHLTGVGPGIAWSIEVAARVSDAVVLDGERVAILMGRRLAVRAAASGALLAELELPGMGAGLAADPDGALLLHLHDACEAALARVAPGGGEIARVGSLGPITHEVPRPPWLGPAGEVVVGYAGALHGWERGGARWWAGGGGFTEQEGAAAAAGDAIETPLLAAGRRLLVAGLAGRGGHAMLAIDLDARRVRALTPEDAVIHLGAPQAIARAAGEPWLVATSVDRARIAVDLAGRLRWRHAAVTPPSQLAVDGESARGAVLAVHSPPEAVWDAYRGAYREAQCFVDRVDVATGLVTATWHAPGPISPGIAAARGRVLAVAEGQLFDLTDLLAAPARGTPMGGP